MPRPPRRACAFLRFWPRFRGKRAWPARPPVRAISPSRRLLGAPALSGVEPPRRATLPPYKRASLAQSSGDVRSRERLAPVFRFVWRIGFGLLFFGRRGPASGAAVAAVSACLRAIAARHFAGWTLRSARNWRFSASLNVASYARRARASYRQAKSANTANAIGTTRGIMRQAITILGLWRTTYRRPCARESTTAGPAARRSNTCPSATRSDGGMP